MKRTDFIIERQEPDWDWEWQFMIKKRWFFLGFIPTNKFKYLFDEYDEFLEFETEETAEKYIQSLI